MTGETFALLASLHGHLAVLGTALLFHPVVTLRTRRGLGRWTRFSADLAAAMLLAPFALGWVIYPAYRASVKPGLYAGSPADALLFESKEHLATMAVALAVSGALVLHAAGARESGRKAAWSLLLAAWLCAAGTIALGITVASRAHPGW